MRLARAMLAAGAALALLGACSSTDDLLDGKKVDYKTAAKLPPLDVPPDLTVPTRDDRYAVPDGGRSATLSSYQAERGQAKPAGSSGAVLPAVDNLRVERTGNQRWLVSNDPPEKLWPVVREFWQESGFLLRQEMPETGIMETDWAENRATIGDSWVTRALGGLLKSAHGTAERDKYRTRLLSRVSPVCALTATRYCSAFTFGWSLRQNASQENAPFLRSISASGSA